MQLKNNLIFLTRGMIAYNFKLVALNPNNNQTPPKKRAYRENRHHLSLSLSLYIGKYSCLR